MNKRIEAARVSFKKACDKYDAVIKDKTASGRQVLEAEDAYRRAADKFDSINNQEREKAAGSPFWRSA